MSSARAKRKVKVKVKVSFAKPIKSTEGGGRVGDITYIHAYTVKMVRNKHFKRFTRVVACPHIQFTFIH